MVESRRFPCSAWCCWPFCLRRCFCVAVMVTFDGLWSCCSERIWEFWRILTHKWAEMGWRPCTILVFQEIAWKYIHSMQSCRACRTEEVGLEGSRRGKEKKKLFCCLFLNWSVDTCISCAVSNSWIEIMSCFTVFGHSMKLQTSKIKNVMG